MRADVLLSRIPFNLVRADHWINKPVKKATRPCKEDYSYYFTHNISITTSGDFNTLGLKLCIDQIGVDRCLYSIGEFTFKSPTATGCSVDFYRFPL